MAGIFGDITKIDTTGASEKTAKQDKLTVKGVEASYKLAEHDLRKMEQYKHIFTKVGRDKQMDPAVIAAITSRESRAGAALDNGWGDHGNGFGLMQVDKRHHTPTGAWNSEQHVSQATEILKQSVKSIQMKHPSWSKEQQLKGLLEDSDVALELNLSPFAAYTGGISAYNAGAGNVRSYERMDVGTTGHDYANDVVARAQFFKHNGY